jgi:hypothetical protein
VRDAAPTVFHGVAHGLEDGETNPAKIARLRGAIQRVGRPSVSARRCLVATAGKAQRAMGGLLADAARQADVRDAAPTVFHGVGHGLEDGETARESSLRDRQPAHGVCPSARCFGAHCDGGRGFARRAEGGALARERPRAAGQSLTASVTATRIPESSAH